MNSYKQFAKELISLEEGDECTYQDVADFCESIENIFLTGSETDIAKLINNLEATVEESADDGGFLDGFVYDDGLFNEMMKLSGLKYSSWEEVKDNIEYESLYGIPAKLITQHHELITQEFICGILEWIDGNIGIPNPNIPDMFDTILDNSHYAE